ncbi:MULTISPECIES: methyltransferase domain-containing protein [unclassified Sphingomonas]|uniref:methyltransferase domain-containing protein n=1 Tax=unclassified Sphingomonas TaxID=196159 RepID=UPI0021514CC5|nr:MULTISPECIES: methyltransferase domain-containing protein [unclassified Sphingomonas]MCR5870123.1 methyltransferase domain-containing protein [Sphingomonas sp. J344]UUX98188.1 methyltransferase domain-containing protein [Sphingomonas sp. J315]
MFPVPTLARRPKDVPYVPTPPEVVEGMLDMAGLKAGERLIDLGSGDGRIPRAAARRGAIALGVEIDADLVARARSLTRLEGLEERARFVRDDLFTVSLRDVDVATLYLLPALNERLKPKLLNEMKAGARVVSHAFDMGDWVHDEFREIADKRVYRWTIPAIAAGEWQLVRNDGTIGRMSIDQRCSRISGRLDGRPIGGAQLAGAALSFTADGKAYRGVVGDRAIVGEGWRAERID